MRLELLIPLLSLGEAVVPHFEEGDVSVNVEVVDGNVFQLQEGFESGLTDVYQLDRSIEYCDVDLSEYPSAHLIWEEHTGPLYEQNGAYGLVTEKRYSQNGEWEFVQSSYSDGEYVDLDSTVDTFKGITRVDFVVLIDASSSMDQGLSSSIASDIQGGIKRQYVEIDTNFLTLHYDGKRIVNRTNGEVYLTVDGSGADELHFQAFEVAMDWISDLGSSENTVQRVLMVTDEGDVLSSSEERSALIRRAQKQGVVLDVYADQVKDQIFVDPVRDLVLPEFNLRGSGQGRQPQGVQSDPAQPSSGSQRNHNRQPSVFDRSSASQPSQPRRPSRIRYSRLDSMDSNAFKHLEDVARATGGFFRELKPDSRYPRSVLPQNWSVDRYASVQWAMGDPYEAGVRVIGLLDYSESGACIAYVSEELIQEAILDGRLDPLGIPEDDPIELDNETEEGCDTTALGALGFTFLAAAWGLRRRRR